MKILEDNARRGKSIKVPLEYRCSYCNSLLLIEDGDCEKDIIGNIIMMENAKYSYYVIKCPCCEEESNLNNYENIRITKNYRIL